MAAEAAALPLPLHPAAGLRQLWALKLHRCQLPPDLQSLQALVLVVAPAPPPPPHLPLLLLTPPRQAAPPLVLELLRRAPLLLLLGWRQRRWQRLQ